MKKNGRLQIRIPEELKKWVQKYAERNHTDVSTLVTRFFVKLKEEEKKKDFPIDAEQV
jgi:hypothetical protein